MFYTWRDVVRILREVRRSPLEEVGEELRGWSWGEPPVVSTRKYLLGVSDVAGGLCSTGRNIYLKYVLRVRPKDNPILQKGRLVHDTFSLLVETAKKLIYEGGGDLDGEGLHTGLSSMREDVWAGIKGNYSLLREDYARWIFSRLWSLGARTYSAALDEALARSPYMRLESIVSATIPYMSEFPINGELVGLSRALRIDAFLPPGILVEFKTRRPRHVFEVALAGYALAFESEYEVPIDYAVLEYIHIDWKRKRIFFRPQLTPISAVLREEFLELRDKAKDNILNEVDPGVAEKCPEECPFRWYCRGEG